MYLTLKSWEWAWLRIRLENCFCKVKRLGTRLIRLYDGGVIIKSLHGDSSNVECVVTIIIIICIYI